MAGKRVIDQAHHSVHRCRNMPTHKHSPDLLIAVGERIQTARVTRGLTQAALAEAVGIEPVTLSRYETGARGASITTLALLAQALGLTLANLMDVDVPISAPDRGPEAEEVAFIVNRLAPERRDLAVRLVRELAR